MSSHTRRTRALMMLPTWIAFSTLMPNVYLGTYSLLQAVHGEATRPPGSLEHGHHSCKDLQIRARAQNECRNKFNFNLSRVTPLWMQYMYVRDVHVKRSAAPSGCHMTMTMTIIDDDDRDDTDNDNFRFQFLCLCPYRRSWSTLTI